MLELNINHDVDKTYYDSPVAIPQHKWYVVVKEISLKIHLVVVLVLSVK